MLSQQEEWRREGESERRAEEDGREKMLLVARVLLLTPLGIGLLVVGGRSESSTQITFGVMGVAALVFAAYSIVLFVYRLVRIFGSFVSNRDEL